MTIQTPQQSLFDPPPLPRKSRKHKQHRHTQASALSFDEIKLKRNKIFLMILSVLAEFDFNDAQQCLTAREMLRLLKVRGLVKPAAERNYLSPRLTELFDLGCIDNPQNEEGQAFIKHVEGDKPASVWKISDKGRELLSCLTELHKEGRQ